MAKIKLGVRPETFAPISVKFTMPDGLDVAILCTYKYRTRKEFGQMLNDMFGAAGETAPEDSTGVDFEKLFSKTGRKNAEHLYKSLAAWDLDEELSLESLEILCDTLPAAAAAMMTAYSAACNEGRVKN